MIEAICPKCQTVNHVGDELMGRYMLCEKCRCRFYVNVPPLGEQLQRVPSNTGIQESPARETTLDDLLWDTQQGERYMIRAIFEQQRELRHLRWVVFGLTAIALVNLVAAMMLLAR